MDVQCHSDPEEAMRMLSANALACIARMTHLPENQKERGLRAIADAALEALGEDRTTDG